ENPYQMLSDWVPESEPEQRVRHEVQRQLDLMASVGFRASQERLSFVVPEKQRTWARQALEGMGIAPGQPWMLLHPGATASSRRYPPKHWADVVQALTDEHGWHVILTGS